MLIRFIATLKEFNDSNYYFICELADLPYVTCYTISEKLTKSFKT